MLIEFTENEEIYSSKTRRAKGLANYSIKLNNNFVIFIKKFTEYLSGRQNIVCTESITKYQKLLLSDEYVKTNGYIIRQFIEFLVWKYKITQVSELLSYLIDPQKKM